MAGRSKRAKSRSGDSRRDTHEPQDATPGDTRQPLVPDAPGEGINRKHPALLIGVASLLCLWLSYLCWIAFASS